MLCTALQLQWCFSRGLCKVLDAHSLKILFLSTSCSFCSLPVIKNYLMNKSGQIQTMLRTGMFGKNFGEETAVALLSTTLQTNKPDFLSKGSNATQPWKFTFSKCYVASSSSPHFLPGFVLYLFQTPTRRWSSVFLVPGKFFLMKKYLKRWLHSYGMGSSRGVCKDFSLPALLQWRSQTEMLI